MMLGLLMEARILTSFKEFSFSFSLRLLILTYASLGKYLLEAVNFAIRNPLDLMHRAEGSLPDFGKYHEVCK